MEQGDSQVEHDATKNTVPPKDDVVTSQIVSLLGERNTVSRDYHRFIEQFSEVWDGHVRA